MILLDPVDEMWWLVKWLYFLNMTLSLSVRLERLISINWVFRSLKFTKLSVPQLTILSRSSLGEEIESTLEVILELDDGLIGNVVEV